MCRRVFIFLVDSFPTATPAAIIYGTALGASQLNATADVAGSFAYTPALGTKLEVGSHLLSVLFTPDSPNYEAVEAQVTLVVAEEIVVPTLSYKRTGNSLTLEFVGDLYESDDLITWKRVEGARNAKILAVPQGKTKFYRTAH